MWCHNCGQDAPRVASPETGRQCCLRCGKPVGQEPSARSEPDRAQGDDAKAERTASTTGHASGYDGWELDEELRHVARRLGTAARPSGGSGKTRRRIDAAHDSLPAAHYGGRPARADRGHFNLGGVLIGAVTWLALTLGLMASACGGVLLVWSAMVGRDDLWNVGLPIAVVGVLSLVVAMVLQLERLSVDHRQTAARLARFDNRLIQLRRDAALSASDARPAGAAFYAHLAEGASPQLLLTDLKGQLELLTQRLGESAAVAIPSSDLE